MTVSRLENLLTTMRLKSEELRRRWSSQAGNLLVEGTMFAHEGFLQFCRQLGWKPVSRCLAMSIAAIPPKVIPYCPSITPVGRHVSSLAKDLERGVCRLQDGTVIPLEAISWRRDELADRLSITVILFHALHWVRELLDAYDLTGNVAYLSRAQDLAARWIDECLYAERPEFLWHEHATPFRALTLCRLWGLCHTVDGRCMDLLPDLVMALVRHAQRLSHDGFYRKDHNHGVAQAYSLLALGLVLGGHREAPRWLEIGRTRLESHMMENVSPEGLHREHSPYYQFFVLQQFLAARRIVQSYGINFSTEFYERLEAMLNCGAHLVKPNGRLPALGDTFCASPIVVEPEEIRGITTAGAQALLFSFTDGAEGFPASATSVIFPRGGCAIFRSGWGNREPLRDERFVAIRLSTFRTAHIHRDAFSCELYAYGDDLIVDSGGPYQYGDFPVREKFLLTTRAHNTVVVDNVDQQVGEATVLHWSAEGPLQTLVAEHYNYPGVLHLRAVLFVRSRYVIILDRLEATDSHRYSQLFHLNPNLNITQRGLEVYTRHLADGPTVQIIPLINEDVEMRLHRGIQLPPQGWVCVGPSQLLPNTVVEYQRSGTSTEFATLLVPSPAARNVSAQASLQGKPFRSEAHLCLRVGDQTDEIVISAAGEMRLLSDSTTIHGT